MTVFESSDRRYLAGLAFEDATTGAPVAVPLQVESDDARFFRTVRGIYVVSWARRLASHGDAFEAPPVEIPPIEAGSIPITISIRDASGYFLPRLYTLRLPRSADPADGQDSMFEPVRVPLYRSARAPLRQSWSAIHASLVAADDGRPVRNALVRAVRDSNDDVVAVAPLTLLQPRASNAPAERTLGHVAIPIAGIETVVWSNTADGAVSVRNVPVRLEIIGVPDRFAVWNPDDFIEAASVDEAHGPFEIVSGRQHNVGTLTVTVPD